MEKIRKEISDLRLEYTHPNAIVSYHGIPGIGANQTIGIGQNSDVLIVNNFGKKRNNLHKRCSLL